MSTVQKDHSSEELFDAELETLRARVRRLNVEEEKIRVMNSGDAEETEKSNFVVEGTEDRDINKDMNKFLVSTAKCAAAQEVDARSVFVGNVDYGSTARDLGVYMSSCGEVNRITILCNKHDGSPKGAAYVEFANVEAKLAAMALDNTIFRGRYIKVSAKRTNIPGMSSPSVRWNLGGRTRFSSTAS